jgi:hypothetical protein
MVALASSIVALATLMNAIEPSAKAHARSISASTKLNSTGTARLHLVDAEGSQLIEEGPVSGALVGSARAELHTGAVFTAKFTIQTHNGSITGYGRALPHGAGRYQSFNGSFVAAAGSGRYAHISGHAGLYGVFDRRTDAVVIQTSGTLTY